MIALMTPFPSSLFPIRVTPNAVAASSNANLGKNIRDQPEARRIQSRMEFTGV